MTKFAVLGLGFMGQKHLSVLENIPQVSVNAIIDHFQESNKNSGVDYYQTLDFFLSQKPEVDLVIIATPNDNHFASAKQLLESGYNVILEKPYCFTSLESNILLETAKKSNAKIFFINQNRNSGTAKFLKQLVEENLLGDIYFVQTNCFWNRNETYYQPNSWKGKKEKDGGVLYTQFFHFVDLLQWTFGNLNLKSAVFNTFRHQNLIEIEDTGSVTLEIEKNQGIAVLNFSTAVFQENLESSMTVIAENGTLKISGQYFDQIEYCNIKNFNFSEELVKKTSNLENLQENIEQIVYQLNANTPLKTDENFKVVKLIEEIYKKKER